jgi:elongation factor 1-alpha
VDRLKLERKFDDYSSPERFSGVRSRLPAVSTDDMRRGDVAGPAADPPTVAETFRAQIVVMQHPSVITAGYTPVLHAHTAQVACTVESVDRTLDPASGETAEENPDYIESGDAAVMTLRPQKPLSIESSSEIPGARELRYPRHGQTIAAGKVLDVTEQYAISRGFLPLVRPRFDLIEDRTE